MSAPTLADELAPYLLGWSAERDHRTPRIALFGNYGQGNVGDEAILHAVLDVADDHARVVVMSKDPDRVRALHHADSESALTLAGVRALLRCDIVAIGGGGIFGNNMTLLPQLLPLLALVLRAMGKQVVFVAIGAYTTTPRWLQRVLRFLVRRSDLVTVRDEETVTVFDSPHSILVPDPGMQIEPAPAEEVQRFLTAQGITRRPLLAVSLKPAVDPTLDTRQIEIAASAITRWTERNPDGAAVMLCLSERGNSGLHFARTDHGLATSVIDAVGQDAHVSIIGSDTPPWLMKGVIAQCAAVLAHRLHAQMFAHDTGVPLLGLSWERKSDVFLDAIGITRIDLTQPVDVATVEKWLDGCVTAA